MGGWHLRMTWGQEVCYTSLHSEPASALSLSTVCSHWGNLGVAKCWEMSSAIGEQSPCLELLCDIPFTLKVTRQGDSDRKDKDTSDENTVLPQNSLGFLKKLKDVGRSLSLKTLSLILIMLWFEYCKVASSNTTCLEAHAGCFRLLMKGILGPYVLWLFDKKVIS